MDETYIKMCDCPEVQRKWKPAVGDHLFDNGKGNVWSSSGTVVISWEYGGDFRTGIFEELRTKRRSKNKFIWLPRQDRLQEMYWEFIQNRSQCPEDDKIYALLHDFDEYIDWGHGKICTSMEQLWLAFYMKEKHNKQWAGEKWVGVNE